MRIRSAETVSRHANDTEPHRTIGYWESEIARRPINSSRRNSGRNSVGQLFNLRHLSTTAAAIVGTTTEWTAATKRATAAERAATSKGTATEASEWWHPRRESTRTKRR